MAGISRDRALWLSRHILPHEPALRSWLKRKAVIGLEIDDIVQESYAKLATLESVDNIRQPKNYLFQIAYSVIVTHFRRSRVVSIRAVNDIDSLTVMADEPSPEQQVEDREELRRLATAIASMPEACRQVFILRRVEGLPQRDVAARLGLTENSVEHHMSRGIRFLMEAFGRGGNPGSRSSMSSNSGSNEHTGNKQRD